MTSKQRRRLALLIVSGTVLVLVGICGGGLQGWQLGVTILGTLVSLSSIACLGSPANPSTFPKTEASQPDAAASPQLFKEWQQQKLAELQLRHEELDERQRDLVGRFARYQEFLEYPIEDSDNAFLTSDTTRLSESDRRVQGLLEAEAERVYEKIRRNGYTVNGDIDVDTIRSEVHALVLSVAHVYSPNSANPLLETSFEQLARSASRVCLHALVLLERLPVDVKRYNINELYGYLRKAVETYGTYQQVAPWVKHLSRGAYVGRLAAGTNPVTLGAWWLATEVGRRGAQKLVENVVDRQAVAVLHNIVTVIGVEVANVYGPGFRQRDGAWVYGAELTELLKRFPVSRESLTQALQEITVLPLRCEYDRVYLYRCVADHRAAGFRIHNSTMLDREQRENIAHRLEQFFIKYIHGAKDKESAAWQLDVESRLDLKLSLRTTATTHAAASANVSLNSDVVAAVTSVHAFMTSVIGTTARRAHTAIEQSDLLHALPLEDRVPLLKSLETANAPFEPPDLDPSDPLTNRFLQALIQAVVAEHAWDQHVEQLVIETICYFRRSRPEAQTMFDGACVQQLSEHCDDDAKVRYLNPDQVKATLSALTTSTRLKAVYRGISVLRNAELVELPEAALVVLGNTANTTRELLLLPESETTTPLWRGDERSPIQRKKGLLIDDCQVREGEWLEETFINAEAIIIAGSMTGGGFPKTFGALLNTTT